jgi:hypothetical protein
MTKISLGGSQWLRESTARWRAEQAAESAYTRLAANVQEARALGHDWRIERLFRRGQLDDDYWIASVLHGAALRFYHDWHLSRGSSEVARERRAAYDAAIQALGQHYGPTVCSIVLENAPLQTAGYALGYTNRSAAVAAALERLNVGLRKLAVHYGILSPN